MFGHDDNQQPVQDNNSVLQAAMPDPVSPVPQDTPSSPTFGGIPTAPSMSEPHITTTHDIPAAAPDASASTPVAPAQIEYAINNDDLLNIKQQALQHLSPLVSHLEQTPEEKFRTTMMMIQASDDQTLVKTAFDAAQAITDDKARAQALLDIINEINYFTQHQGNQQAAALAL